MSVFISSAPSRFLTRNLGLEIGNSGPDYPQSEIHHLPLLLFRGTLHLIQLNVLSEDVEGRRGCYDESRPAVEKSPLQDVAFQKLERRTEDEVPESRTATLGKQGLRRDVGIRLDRLNLVREIPVIVVQEHALQVPPLALEDHTIVGLRALVPHPTSTEQARDSIGIPLTMKDPPSEMSRHPGHIVPHHLSCSLREDAQYLLFKLVGDALVRVDAEDPVVGGLRHGEALLVDVPLVLLLEDLFREFVGRSRPSGPRCGNPLPQSHRPTSPSPGIPGDSSPRCRR